MTDDELRAIYCEGMAAAFQKSIDAKKSAAPASLPSSSAPLRTDVAFLYTQLNE